MNPIDIKNAFAACGYLDEAQSCIIKILSSEDLTDQEREKLTQIANTLINQNEEIFALAHKEIDKDLGII